MLKFLYEQMGVVRQAAPKAGIDASTHYIWLARDQEYRKKVEAVKNEILDMAEAVVIKKITEMDLKAAIYYLDSKGYERGYGQKPGTAIQVNTAVNNQQGLVDVTALNDFLVKHEEEKEARFLQVTPTEANMSHSGNMEKTKRVR